MEDTVQKKQRRSRKDMNQRNHLCKHCGKGYLSNAALYTHIKNKHQTKKSKTGEKVNESVAGEISDKQVSNIEAGKKIEKKQQCLLGEKALEELKNFMRKFFNERNKTNNTVEQAFEGVSEEEKKLFWPLLIYWEQQPNAPTDKFSICINYVIGYFLHLMSKKVSPFCIQFLIKFFFNFRLGLIYETRKNSICEKQNANNLPNYFNQIIMNGHISQAESACQLMSNTDIVKRIIQYFGKWIYDQKFTDFKTIPNY